MNTLTLVTVFLGIWIVIGLVTGLWMIRRGHDPRWMFIAVALGPLFAPIALERAERGSRLALSGTGEPPVLRAQSIPGPRVLVGLDGSPESDSAFKTALALFGANCSRFVLAEVVYYEAAEGSNPGLDIAAARLAGAAAHVESLGFPASFEVLAGPPGETLRRFAEQQDIDLVVVGRRGRGLNTRFLGSVSAYLVAHSSVPVLIGEPADAANNIAGDPVTTEP